VALVASEIAGLEKARLWFGAERIIDKLLRRERRSVQITPRYSRPTDIQLACYTDWYWLTITIQNINLRVGNWPPDRNRSGRKRSRRSFVHARPDPRFRRSVLIYQPCSGRTSTPESELFTQQCFSADNESSGAVSHVAGLQIVTEHFQMRGCDLDQTKI